MRPTSTYPACSTGPHVTAAINPFVSHSSPPSFHQFLSPVRRKKKTNRAPFAVENRKNRPKKSSVVPGPNGQISHFLLSLWVYKSPHCDGRASAVAQTKNTAVAPTTSTAAGKNSDSCTDEEHGCRANRVEEKAHREGSYTHASISFHPGRTCYYSGGRSRPRFKFSASVLQACSSRREKTEKGPCNPREQDCLK
jgi:hypothetical protein